MSMAINRISASSVAAVLYPVMKPSRVAKIDSGNRANVVAAGTSSQAVQGVSGSQSDASGTAEQAHAAFQYALAGLSSMATDTTVAQPSTEASSNVATTRSTSMAQSSGVQQAGSAYAQVEQQAGQALDITV